MPLFLGTSKYPAEGDFERTGEQSLTERWREEGPPALPGWMSQTAYGVPGDGPPNARDYAMEYEPMPAPARGPEVAHVSSSQYLAHFAQYLSQRNFVDDVSEDLNTLQDQPPASVKEASSSQIMQSRHIRCFLILLIRSRHRLNTLH